MKLFDKLKYGIVRLITRKPVAKRNSKVHRKAKVGNGAQIVNSTVGRYSYIFGSSVICTEVGAFCSIAAGSTIGGGKHPTNWVSTSPVFYRGKNVLKTNFSNNEFEEYAKTHIGNDVWIGSKCLIKGGVSIGDGAIIGMGSVVTHDVPPYEIWAGNPARFIRKRFDDEVCQKLQVLKWWEYSDAELNDLGDMFNNPSELINYLEEKNQ